MKNAFLWLILKVLPEFVDKPNVIVKNTISFLESMIIFMPKNYIKISYKIKTTFKNTIFLQTCIIESIWNSSIMCSLIPLSRFLVLDNVSFQVKGRSVFPFMSTKRRLLHYESITTSRSQHNQNMEIFEQYFTSVTETTIIQQMEKVNYLVNTNLLLCT